MLGHHNTPTGPARPVSAPLALARRAAAVAAEDRYRLDMLMEAFAMADGRHPGPPHLDHVRFLVALVRRPVNGDSRPF